MDFWAVEGGQRATKSTLHGGCATESSPSQGRQGSGATIEGEEKLWVVVADFELLMTEEDRTTK